jgi:putative aminopeptidase FrvX
MEGGFAPPFVVYDSKVIRPFFVLLLLISPLAAQIRSNSVDKAIVLERLQSAPNKNTDRQLALAKMFTDVGCEPILQPVKHYKTANVICILKGSTDDVIIVGAHLDHVSAGDGIIDDWSGAALLPTLYQSLKEHQPKHSIIFVGFAEEETGLNGSAFYVQQMTPSDKLHAKAMVNLECLGLARTKVWSSHSDMPLLELLITASRALQIDIEGVNIEKVGTADSESFARAKIPRITLHTVTQESLHLLHTRDDNMKAIHPDDYYENYRLIAGYLATVDSLLGDVTPTAPAMKAGK